MHQDGLFFRVLRRFNMILLTIIGLSIVIGGGFAAWKYCEHKHGVRDFYPPYPGIYGSSVAVAPPAKADKFEVDADNYGSPDTVYGPYGGSLFVLNRLMPPPAGAPEEYLGYAPREAVNLMVVDAKTGEGHWLFAGANRVIISRDAVYEGAPVANAMPGKDTRPVIGMVMAVFEGDTGAAKPAKSTPVFYIWRKGDTQAAKLFAVDEVLSMGQIGADRYMIVYKTGKETKSAIYSVPEFKLLAEKVLPEAPR